MNFNFNDNLFGAIEDDIEKEIMNFRNNKPKGAPANGGSEPTEQDKKQYEEEMAMLQKEFDKMNLNMNDLEMLEKDENLLNQILMELSQGK